jgi:hypothetical protein
MKQEALTLLLTIAKTYITSYIRTFYFGASNNNCYTVKYCKNADTINEPDCIANPNSIYLFFIRHVNFNSDTRRVYTITDSGLIGDWVGNNYSTGRYWYNQGNGWSSFQSFTSGLYFLKKLN